MSAGQELGEACLLKLDGSTRSGLVIEWHLYNALRGLLLLSCRTKF